MTDKERDDFFREFEKRVLPIIESSAATITLYPDTPEHVDAKICLETGAMVLLDKPIILLVAPGVEPSKKMLKVADVVLRDFTPGDAHDQERLQRAIERLMEREA